MNTQIEHLDNHTARLTVQVEPERVDKAMRDAAKRIAKEVNIPGFRKGKAPYNIVVQRFGAQAVLSEAIDLLGNDLYREALDEAKIEPYAPGSLENVDTDSGVKLTFVVPKRPEVNLGAYRDIRQPFSVNEVEDEAVTRAMKTLQERRAVIETAARPAQLGDIAKVKINATVTHPASEGHEHDHTHEGEPEHEGEQAPEGEPEGTHEHDHEAHAEGTPHTDPYMDDEIEALLVEDTEEDDVMPGFSQNIVGMSAGDQKTFTLAFPADNPNPGLAGHTFDYNVTVEEVKSRTLPALNDDFAKTVSENEIDNLLSLRMDVRKQLQDAAKREAESKYADEVLDKIVEQATVKYPEEMVGEYTDEILTSLDNNLRERGLSLADYKRIENKDDNALRQDYRDTAIKRLLRALVLGEVVNQEKLDVSNADVEQQIDRMSQQFGEQAAVFRQMLMRDETRRNIAMDLITNRALQRLIAIARGENPPIGPDPAEGAAETTESTQPALESTENASPAPAEASAQAETPTQEQNTPAADVSQPAQPTQETQPAPETPASTAQAEPGTSDQTTSAQ